MRVAVILGGNMYEKSIINYYVYEFIYNVDFASISSGSNIKRKYYRERRCQCNIRFKFL